MILSTASLITQDFTPTCSLPEDHALVELEWIHYYHFILFISKNNDNERSSIFCLLQVCKHVTIIFSSGSQFFCLQLSKKSATSYKLKFLDCYNQRKILRWAVYSWIFIFYSYYLFWANCIVDCDRMVIVTNQHIYKCLQ